MNRLLLVLVLAALGGCQNSTAPYTAGAHCRLVADLAPPHTVEVCIAADGQVSASFID